MNIYIYGTIVCVPEVFHVGVCMYMYVFSHIHIHTSQATYTYIHIHIHIHTSQVMDGTINGVHGVFI